MARLACCGDRPLTIAEGRHQVAAGIVLARTPRRAATGQDKNIGITFLPAAAAHPGLGAAVDEDTIITCGQLSDISIRTALHMQARGEWLGQPVVIALLTAQSWPKPRVLLALPS